MEKHSLEDWNLQEKTLENVQEEFYLQAALKAAESKDKAYEAIADAYIDSEDFESAKNVAKQAPFERGKIGLAILSKRPITKSILTRTARQQKSI